MFLYKKNQRVNTVAIESGTEFGDQSASRGELAGELALWLRRRRWCRQVLAGQGSSGWIADCVARPSWPHVVKLPCTDAERCDGWLGRRFARRHDVGMRRCQVMPQAARTLTVTDTHQLLRTLLTLSFTAAYLFHTSPNPWLGGSFRCHLTTISTILLTDVLATEQGTYIPYATLQKSWAVSRTTLVRPTSKWFSNRRCELVGVRNYTVSQKK